MNIFVLNEDPKLAARDQCNAHAIKMCLETSQLLCTVAIKKGFTAPYKPTHKNHPATKWLEQSSANWNWLCLHGLALCEEYTLRYNKIHKCQPLIKEMQTRTKEIFGDDLPYTEHTKFSQCMPDIYKQEDAVEAYRSYYKNEKRSFAKWKLPGTEPEWF